MHTRERAAQAGPFGVNTKLNSTPKLNPTSKLNPAGQRGSHACRGTPFGVCARGACERGYES